MVGEYIYGGGGQRGLGTASLASVVSCPAQGPLLGSDTLCIVTKDLGRKRDTKAQRGRSFLWGHRASQGQVRCLSCHLGPQQKPFVAKQVLEKSPPILGLRGNQC